MARNTVNPSAFGSGVIGAEAVVEERTRVQQLEKLLGRAGVEAVGLAYAQELHDAITSRQGRLPEFRVKA